MTREASPRKRFLRLGRRAAIGGIMSSFFSIRADAQGALGPAPNLEEDLRNLRLLDLTEGGRRFVLVVPKYQSPDRPLPLAIFLHGLGETTNERLGAYAWVEKYGLGSAWQRLKRPPIERTTTRGEWTDARLAEVNAELAARPFRGFAMACPYMPNIRGPQLDEYATWIEKSLLPRARKEANVFVERDRTYLCGVSLGGYVSLEMFVRLPHLFGAWAGVQTAIGTFAAPGYADKIAKAPPTSLFLLTSSQDHWKSSSEALAAAFTARKIAHSFRVTPGPHDQPWLRESGTIETLLWLDRLYVPKQPE